jgi:hypothetical protein
MIAHRAYSTSEAAITRRLYRLGLRRTPERAALLEQGLLAARLSRIEWRVAELELRVTALIGGRE